MPKGETLKKWQQKATKEDQKNKAIKAGETRKRNLEKKRQLKEILEAFLEIQRDNGDTYSEAMCIAMIQKAINGDVHAFEVVRDSIGQKPTDKVEVVDSTINITLKDDDTE